MATKPKKSRQTPTKPSSVEGTPRGRHKHKRDEDSRQEAESDKEDAVLFARHDGKVYKVVYTPPSMSDFLKDKKWGWSEVGDVDDTVWDQLRNYIPSAGMTTPVKTTETQPAPSAGATTRGKTTEPTQPAPSAGMTTPVKTTETQPAPSAGATTSGQTAGTQPAPSEPGGLEDTHVLELSKRITNEQELKDLGIKALKLPKYIIQAALYNHRTSIQDAAYSVLSTWLKDQPSRKDAYRNLITGLQKAQMNQLAAELQYWVEGVSAESQKYGEKIVDLQSRLKDSLERNYKDFLKHDWLEDGHTFPLMQYYTDLVWTRMVKEAMGRQPRSMKGLDEILKIPGAGEKCLKILVVAKPGMGKSSSMAMLAMKWVKDKTGDFPFDFVFLLPLRNVDENCSLAQLLVNEHELEDADTELVSNIIRGKTSHKVLLLLDGYDEYTPGTNTELDTALQKHLGKCLLILTSRPKEGKDFTGKIRNTMDGEVVIEGFSEENIKKCCSQYLGSDREAEQLLEAARANARIYQLLKVPIILLITSVLYNEDEKKSLPESRTKLYQDLYEFIMDRSTLKPNNFGCHSSEIPNIEHMLQTLGKFAWEALQNDIRQLLINKAALEKECPDIMKLGLLHEVGKKKATARKQPAFLSYEHKSLQEFGASKFVTKRLETSKNIKETLKELFPSWEAVQRYREVVLFVAGLMKDSRPLVQYIYEMQVDDPLSIDVDLFRSLHAECAVRLVDDPLHNKYINHYNHMWDSDTTPVYFPSRLYHFERMRHGVVLKNHLKQEEEIPPCAVYIRCPNGAVSDALLSTCSEISTHQELSDLYMWSVTCDNPTITPPRLAKPVSVIVYECELPNSFVEKIFRQLFGCGESLQRLGLHSMDLSPFEPLIDELLEDLVAHHEAGLAQRKLVLRLYGSKFRCPTNLSKEFVEKWRKVDSIDCEEIGDD